MKCYIKLLKDIVLINKRRSSGIDHCWTWLFIRLYRNIKRKPHGFGSTTCVDFSPSPPPPLTPPLSQRSS